MTLTPDVSGMALRELDFLCKFAGDSRVGHPNILFFPAQPCTERYSYEIPAFQFYLPLTFFHWVKPRVHILGP